MTRRPVAGQVSMDGAPEWSEAPGQLHLLELLEGTEPAAEPAPAFVIRHPLTGAQMGTVPARCGVRYSDTQEGPLTTCALPAGHAGRHEEIKP